VNPDSTTQVEEQPSLGLVLPSSQVSDPSRTPFPQFWHTLGVVPLQVHPDSVAQVAEHPSPGIWLPSSHDSAEPSRTPLPQLKWHASP
jgi:hypothetical protein